MKFSRTILTNGVRVLAIPMKGNPTVTVMVTVATGSYYEEPSQSGISHFLEHMCFKGTVKRPLARMITTELDSIGAVYNAFTTNEMTGYYAKSDTKHFERIGDVVSDVYLNSTFPEAEIEKEKGVVLGEIDMYSDDPQEKVQEALRVHMYKGEPAERDILGSKETVSSITRADLVAYKALHYTPSNTLVTIAGGIHESEMILWAQKTFSELKGGEPGREFSTRDREQEEPECVFVDKDTDQAHIVLAWRGFSRHNPDRYAAYLVKNILRGGMSSRLFIKLREEMGSGYYIGAHNSFHETFGNFMIATGTTAKRVPEIIKAILSEVKRLETEPVSQEELEKVKELMRAHMIMALETSDNVADFFADQEVLSDAIRTPEEFDAIFDKLGAEDVMRVAKEMFDPRRLNLAVIGKNIDKKAASAALGAVAA